MSCEHADEDLGVGIYESFAEWITVEVLYYDDVAVLKAADYGVDLIVKYPCSAGLQKSSLSLF